MTKARRHEEPLLLNVSDLRKANRIVRERHRAACRGARSTRRRVALANRTLRNSASSSRNTQPDSAPGADLRPDDTIESSAANRRDDEECQRLFGAEETKLFYLLQKLLQVTGWSPGQIQGRFSELVSSFEDEYRDLVDGARQIGWPAVLARSKRKIAQAFLGPQWHVSLCTPRKQPATLQKHRRARGQSRAHRTDRRTAHRGRNEPPRSTEQSSPETSDQLPSLDGTRITLDFHGGSVAITVTPSG